MRHKRLAALSIAGYYNNVYIITFNHPVLKGIKNINANREHYGHH